MLARLEFKEQNRDEKAEPEAFQQTIEKYEASCKAEGEEVKEAGGLNIVGTERHESRRIDNQLRGRAGRQGDPGSSRFYLSLEDDLMRIFAGDRVKSLMERMGMPDDEPIEHPWVTKSIGDAQGKVEGRNFDIRKNLLEYDDVMSEQRKTVYKIRQQLLLGIYTPEIIDDDGKPTGKMRDIKPIPHIVEDVKPAIEQMIVHYGTPMTSPTPGAAPVPPPRKVEDVKELYSLESLREDIYKFWGYRIDFRENAGKEPQKVYERLLTEIAQSLTEQRERLLDLVDGILGAIVEESCPSSKPPEDWDWKGIRDAFYEHFQVKPVDYDSTTDPADLAHKLYLQAEKVVAEKEKELGTELLLRFFRHYYLEEIDRGWKEHLTSMEHLRDGIGLRGYAQKDPKQEYKREGYDVFIDMMAASSSNVASKLFKVKMQRETEIERIEREDARRHQEEAAALQMRHGSEIDGGDEQAEQAQRSQRRPQPRALPSQPPQVRQGPKTGRNDPCPCGSGQKFKKCHGAVLEEEGAVDAEDARP